MRPSSRLTSHQSKKFVVNKKAKSYFIGLLLLVSAFTTIFSLSELSYLYPIAIKDITINGTRADIGFKLTLEALKVIDGSYLGIFSKSNLFMYPHNRLVASALSSIPQIETISVKRNGLVGLSVDVTERVPKAVACISLPEFLEQENIIADNDNCFLADGSGLIFDKITSSSTIPLNRYYIPNLSEATSTSENILGLYATSTAEFVALQSFYNGIRKAGMKPVFLLVKDGGEYEIYANDVIIYFNNLRPFDEQLLNLISFWNHPSNAKYHNDTRSSFEYIDIRYGSNVFYRLIQ